MFLEQLADPAKRDETKPAEYYDVRYIVGDGPTFIPFPGTKEVNACHFCGKPYYVMYAPADGKPGYLQCGFCATKM